MSRATIHEKEGFILQHLKKERKVSRQEIKSEYDSHFDSLCNYQLDEMPNDLDKIIDNLWDKGYLQKHRIAESDYIIEYHKHSEQRINPKSDILPRNTLIKYPDLKTTKYLTMPTARAIQSRRGQEEFRDKVLTRDGKECRVTGCKIESILEAAHIVPHSEGGSMEKENGITLRSDIHTLFDLKMLIFLKPSPPTRPKSINGRTPVQTQGLTGKARELIIHFHINILNDEYYKQYHKKSIQFQDSNQINFDAMDKRCQLVLDSWPQGVNK